jgi:hypothetical protein
MSHAAISLRFSCPAGHGVAGVAKGRSFSPIVLYLLHTSIIQDIGVFKFFAVLPSAARYINESGQVLTRVVH